jgi:LmbE family N-acetylglucosaminyl deacetylase
LTFAPGAGGALRILCVGAHPDDIEIGCGGTLLMLLAERSDVEVTWVVLSGEGCRAQEAQDSAQRFLVGAASAQVEVCEYRDGYFPYEGGAIKEYFQDLRNRCAPDLILTHRRRDWHQDLRLVSELTWNAFRRHLILEYEIPKYDGDLESPNVFVPLTEQVRQQKTELLMELFGTQRSKSWFTPETFNGLMRLRGIESASPSGYAEGFHARKLVMHI